MLLRDHLEPFDFRPDFQERCANEVNALQTLWVGLDHLASEVKKLEIQAAGAVPPNVVGFFFGPGPNPLLPSQFQWYAVSACSFVQLFGSLRFEHTSTASTPGEYMQTVLPEVLIFRDKVAAHTARSYRGSGPDRRDLKNQAERYASICPQVAFDFGKRAYVASPLTIKLKRNGVESSSEALSPWSLTEVHDQLRARYFPVAGAPNATPTPTRSSPRFVFRAASGPSSPPGTP